VVDAARCPKASDRLGVIEDRVPGLKELVGVSRLIKLSDLFRTASRPRDRSHSSSQEKRSQPADIYRSIRPDWTTKKHKNATPSTTRSNPSPPSSPAHLRLQDSEVEAPRGPPEKNLATPKTTNLLSSSKSTAEVNKTHTSSPQRQFHPIQGSTLGPILRPALSRLRLHL